MVATAREMISALARKITPSSLTYVISTQDVEEDFVQVDTELVMGGLLPEVSNNHSNSSITPIDEKSNVPIQTTPSSSSSNQMPPADMSTLSSVVSNSESTQTIPSLPLNMCTNLLPVEPVASIASTVVIPEVGMTKQPITDEPAHNDLPMELSLPTYTENVSADLVDEDGDEFPIEGQPHKVAIDLNPTPKITSAQLPWEQEGKDSFAAVAKRLQSTSQLSAKNGARMLSSSSLPKKDTKKKNNQKLRSPVSNWVSIGKSQSNDKSLQQVGKQSQAPAANQRAVYK